MKSYRRILSAASAALAVAVAIPYGLSAWNFFPSNPWISAFAQWALSALLLVPTVAYVLAKTENHDNELRIGRDDPRFAEVQDAFLSHVSHEFRSPLATIIGYLDLLYRSTDQLSEKHADYVRTMRQSAQRLKGFVDNVIDMSKMDAGVMECAMEPIAVRDVFERVTQTLQPLCDANHVAIKIQCSNQICIEADAELLQKILLQVVTNALNYTPEKGHVTLWSKDGGEKSVLMGVTDTGVGIPRTMFDRVFEKFEQVKETKDKVRKTHGAGLGLTVAKRLVELQGGRIWVQSSSKKGSTISWVLPKPVRRAAPAERTPARDRLAA